jgi:hypothetical protein
MRSQWLLIAMLVAGCAEGDFGRIKSSLVTDDIHSWVGATAAASAGIAPSRYGLTDEERELRDLAYPLIEAPFDRHRWYSILGEYGLNGIRSMPFDRTAYARVLMTRAARSPASRYELLLDDIRNDMVRIGPFFRTAAQVSDLDNKRAQSLPYIPDLSEKARANAFSRIAENQLAVAWVQHSLHQRVEAYRYALARLVVVYPSSMAVEVERTLNRLQLEIGEIRVAEIATARAPISK